MKWLRVYFLGLMLIAATAALAQSTVNPTIPAQNAPLASACPLIPNLVPGGVTTNDAALATALATIPSKGGCLTFPAGVYAFASQIGFNFTANQAGLKLIGRGIGATTLYWPNGGTNGLVVDFFDPSDSVHIEDMTIATNGTMGSGIFLENTHPIFYGSGTSSILRNILFTGSTIYDAIHYWGTGVNIKSVSDVELDNVGVFNNFGFHGGIGASFGGSPVTANTNAATTSGNILSFTPGSISSLKAGQFAYDATALASLQYGQVVSVNYTTGAVTLAVNVTGTVASGDSIQFSDVAAIYLLNNCTFLGIQYAVVIEPGVQGVVFHASNTITTIGISAATPGYNEVQLTISDSQLAATQSDVVITSPMDDVSITGSLIQNSDTTGSYPAISLGGTNRSKIIGNSIYQNSGTYGTSVGLFFNAEGATITGNIFQGFYNSIELGSSSSYANVQSNTYLPGVTYKVVNNGTNNTVGGGSD